MYRRDFLKISGALAATGAASSVLGSCSPAIDGIPASEIKESYATDVLVVGGGPAGVSAAVCAARQGAKTMLVEASGMLGGMATMGLVAPFMTSFDTTGEVQVIRGIFEEAVQRMVAMGGAIHPSMVRAGGPYTAWITAGHDHVTPFEAEAFKFVLDSMVTEAGVKVLCHASFVRPLLKGNSINGITVLTRSGLENIRARVVIDCTGDADVAARSGVPCEFGNPDTGRVQPATMFLHICNVDSKALEADVQANLHTFHKENGVSYRCLHWRVAEAEANNEWHIARKSVNIYKSVKDDEWAVNTSRVKNVDSTDSESLTAAEMEGRRQVQEIMNFFHKYVPGCKNATLKASASTMGIRESRHIKGLHTLTADELIGGIVPEDSILLASNSVDVHGRNGDNSTEYRTVEGGRWYGVPYRSLLPEGIDNLLVAGRSLSATSDAAGAVRVMPPCMAMGQAAGTAAALAVKAGCAPAALAPSDLIASLKQQNVFFGE